MLRLDRRIVFAGVCVLALAFGALVYLPGLPGDFIFDDISSIVANPAIRPPNLGLQSLIDAVFSSPTGGLLRPVSMLSFTFNAYFFGISAFWFKLINILIHLGCGVLLWFVSREVLRAHTRNGGQPIPEMAARWLALGATLAWVVHPLNLTSVLYVVQRETALSGLFTAAALFTYLAGRRRQQELGKGQWLIWLLTPLFGLLGVLSKETAVLLPAYLLVCEITLLGFRGRDGRQNRSVHAFFGLLLWLPAAVALALWLRHPGALLASYDGRDFTLYQRLLTEARVLMDYLRWTFVPDIRQLALFHDDIPVSQGLLQPVTTLASLIALTLLLAAGFGLRRKLPLLSFGILWFFAGHALESTVLPLELAYEHRNYLPIFGLLLGVSGTLYCLAQRGGWLRGAIALNLAAVLLFGGATALRASEWSSELEFAKAEPRHHPNSPRALSELSWAYLQYVVVRHDPSLVPLAVAAAERSKAVDHYGINQDVGLAYMYVGLKDFPNAKARLAMAAEGAKEARPSATLQLALQTMIIMATPENEQLYGDMHQVLLNATTDPKLMRDICFYATVWNTLGIFRFKIEDVPGSLEAMNRAVQYCPGSPKLRENYASMLLDYGDTDYAGQQLVVLRQMHDIRTLSVLRDLEQHYQQVLADKQNSVPPASPKR